MENVEDLIKYRIERANECFVEAKHAAGSNFWGMATNRLYYACFHAIQALFLHINIETYTHKGTKAQLHLHFVKTGIMDKRLGYLFNILQNKREDADYKPEIKLSKEDVEPFFEQTTTFINTVKTILKNSQNS